VDSNVIGKSKTTDLTQPVTRKDKLEAVSHLFQLCYRTVIPNQPPTVNSNANLIPDSLSSFNPRPIGTDFLLLYFLLFTEMFFY
ncbi:unnamed protein product, partial [Rotaria magnacalcarata]